MSEHSEVKELFETSINVMLSRGVQSIPVGKVSFTTSVKGKVDESGNIDGMQYEASFFPSKEIIEAVTLYNAYKSGELQLKPSK